MRLEQIWHNVIGTIQHIRRLNPARLQYFIYIEYFLSIFLLTWPIGRSIHSIRRRNQMRRGQLVQPGQEFTARIELLAANTGLRVPQVRVCSLYAFSYNIYHSRTSLIRTGLEFSLQEELKKIYNRIEIVSPTPYLQGQ